MHVITYTLPNPDVVLVNLILLTTVFISVEIHRISICTFFPNTKIKSGPVSMSIFLSEMGKGLKYVAVVILQFIIIFYIFYHDG